MKGIIYKIICNETNETYYGSTSRDLETRIKEHKRHYKSFLKNKFGYCCSYKIIEKGNYSYSLVETVECLDKKQLEDREGYYIKNFDCINKKINGQSQEQYRKNNKEKINLSNKKYREENKDKINKWRENNKEKMKIFMADYYQKNKERIKERSKNYYKNLKERLMENEVKIIINF